MKSLLLAFCLLFSSCATMPFVRTAPQEKIEKNEDQLKQNANKIIEIAKKELRKKLEESEKANKQKDEKILLIISQLEEAQAALDAKISDTKDIPIGPNIQDYFNNIKKSNEKLLNENKNLENKISDLSNLDTIKKIERDAVENDHKLTRYKWYAIAGSLLIGVLAYLYFFPSTGLNLIKLFFK